MSIDLLPQLVKYVLAPIYLMLFTVGVCGNIWVISVVVQILRTLTRQAIANRHVYVYIISLAIVDLLVLITVPLVATDMIVGSWMFGGLLCRLNYALESSNKILSTFILTAVSWDRCMAICWPFRITYHRTRMAVIIVVVFAITASLLLLPIHLNATVSPPYQNASVMKCHNNLNHRQLRVFMSYIFMVGFCLPAALMTIFYALMLNTVFGHRRRLSSGVQSSVPLKKVALSTLLVVTFYYLVWTPYWLAMLWFVVVGEPPRLGSLAVLIMYIVHALPYMNSAFNWLFYAYLNQQLRRSHCLSQELRRQSQAPTASCNLQLGTTVHLFPNSCVCSRF